MVPRVHLVRGAHQARGQVQPVNVGGERQAPRARRVPEPVLWTKPSCLVRVVLHGQAAWRAQHAALRQRVQRAIQAVMPQDEIEAQGHPTGRRRGDGRVVLG